MAQTVLVVEDEYKLRELVRTYLERVGLEVFSTGSGAEALSQAATGSPDLVILDLGLPDVDGTEVIVAFRGWSRAPIIVLSGRTSPGDKIGALDAGADDYVTKPFAMGELLARLRAALRRDEVSGGGAGAVATIGRWAIDLSALAIRPSDARTDPADSVPRLTPTEWRILTILLHRPEQLVSSAQLLAGVWGPGFENRTNYLRFHMARLRRKLEDDPSRPRHLLTEPGMGYRYQP